jgi:sterol desaturase/sphingolipid hydroxylase (fatty acid hydroxylase superfamily)
LFLIEGFIPRRIYKTDQTIRWLSNIALALFDHFFMIAYSLLIVGLLLHFKPDSSFLKYFKVSDIPAFFILLFLMELIGYWIHRIYHHIPLLWRIHAVHHSDTEIDVSTTYRHHPFEPMINALIITPIIFALGAPAITIILYNLIRTGADLFSHSNIVLPEKLDRVLRLFVITPDFHRMHHTSNQKYTDSNYSTIFPVFDHLFGSATKHPYDELAKMEIGLEVLRAPEDNRFDKMLMTPFIYKKN